MTTARQPEYLEQQPPPDHCGKKVLAESSKPYCACHGDWHGEDVSVGGWLASLVDISVHTLALCHCKEHLKIFHSPFLLTPSQGQPAPTVFLHSSWCPGQG